MLKNNSREEAKYWICLVRLIKGNVSLGPRGMYACLGASLRLERERHQSSVRKGIGNICRLFFSFWSNKEFKNCAIVGSAMSAADVTICWCATFPFHFQENIDKYLNARNARGTYSATPATRPVRVGPTTRWWRKTENQAEDSLSRRNNVPSSCLSRCTKRRFCIAIASKKLWGFTRPKRGNKQWRSEQ